MESWQKIYLIRNLEGLQAEHPKKSANKVNWKLQGKFKTMDETKKNVTRQLMVILKVHFKECFENLRWYWEKYVQFQGIIWRWLRHHCQGLVTFSLILDNWILSGQINIYRWIYYILTNANTMWDISKQ